MMAVAVLAGGERAQCHCGPRPPGCGVLRWSLSHGRPLCTGHTGVWVLRGWGAHVPPGDAHVGADPVSPGPVFPLGLCTFIPGVFHPHEFFSLAIFPPMVAVALG